MTPEPLDRLAAVARDPAKLDDLSGAELERLAGEIARLRAGVYRRLAEPSPTPDDGGDVREDRMLNVEEAAEILDVAPRWLYDRSDDLPFARKLAPRTLRFSERGLYRWLESRP